MRLKKKSYLNLFVKRLFAQEETKGRDLCPSQRFSVFLQEEMQAQRKKRSPSEMHLFLQRTLPSEIPFSFVLQRSLFPSEIPFSFPSEIPFSFRDPCFLQRSLFPFRDASLPSEILHLFLKEEMQDLFFGSFKEMQAVCRRFTAENEKKKKEYPSVENTATHCNAMQHVVKHLNRTQTAPINRFQRLTKC